MKTRVDYSHYAPDAIKIMQNLEGYISKTDLDSKLVELLRLRASQINGCAFCVDYHVASARKNGESERRLDAVVVWRESPFFTERERVALAWAEAVTLISKEQTPDHLYQDLLKHFNEKEIVDLTLAIISINSWNRVAIAFRRLPK
jgi:AhpD family alkylhydroperoxidase